MLLFSHVKFFFHVYLHLCCSVTQSCLTLCDPTDCSMPGFPVFHYLLELPQTHLHWVGDASNHPVLCHPLLLLPLIVSSIRIFSNGSALHIRCSKYWKFSFSISPFNEYSGLISWRIDWFDLLAIQRTVKRLLQHHISEASIFWHSAFFIVQLSHPYMTTGKTTALTRWTFVGKVVSLLLSTLSCSVIAFLPRSKCLLISWLQSPSAVILEPKKIKSVTVSIVSPSIWHEVMGLDTMWSSFFECWALSQLSSFIFIYLLQFLASILMQNSWKGCLFLLSPVSILWLFNTLWSDFHASHLSENVFVKTVNDFYTAVSKNHFSLFFLDKSAAFDIADHFLLDTVLQFSFQDTFLYVPPTKLSLLLQFPFLFFPFICNLLTLEHRNSQYFSLSLFPLCKYSNVWWTHPSHASKYESFNNSQMDRYSSHFLSCSYSYIQKDMWHLLLDVLWASMLWHVQTCHLDFPHNCSMESLLNQLPLTTFFSDSSQKSHSYVGFSLYFTSQTLF